LFIIIGGMMKTIRLTITELADVTGIHRQTVSKRLQDIPPGVGSAVRESITT
jgi:plasmid maintenance system antidote protein VapI